ncbi:MAG: hypothetical protein Q9213_002178 [Squamulea squamosa]
MYVNIISTLVVALAGLAAAAPLKIASTVATRDFVVKRAEDPGKGPGNTNIIKYTNDLIMDKEGQVVTKEKGKRAENQGLVPAKVIVYTDDLMINDTE